MDTEPEQHKSRHLEKQVRILTKKLQRSEADRRQLEVASEEREQILKGVIRDLERSQTALERRSHELEVALIDLQVLQQKLIESEKMSALGVLVAGIAHEINNPISFIFGNLDFAYKYTQDLMHLIQLYEHHYPQPASQIQQESEAIELDFIKQDLEKVFRSMQVGAERVSTIVKSLRTFSRLGEATLKTIDVNESIDSALVIVNYRLKPTSDNPNGIHLIRDYGQLPPIACYASQLNQVFVNLLMNAIDALEEANEKRTAAEQTAYPSTIAIKTYLSTEHEITISIADNGLGIPSAIQPKIFDPFFTTKNVGKGTGLGLSVSYQVVTGVHGGQLDCYSNTGRGTEFVVTLPVHRRELYRDPPGLPA